MFEKTEKKLFMRKVFYLYILLNGVFFSNYRCIADMQGGQYQISGDNMNVFDNNAAPEKKGHITKNNKETDKKTDVILNTGKDKDQNILDKTDWGVYRISMNILFTVSAITVLFSLQKIFKNNQIRKRSLLNKKN